MGATGDAASARNRAHPISAITLTLAMLIQGCAAVPLAVVAGSALDAGGGVLVKRGTEYAASGTVRRTFTLPLDNVHAAVLEAFHDTQVVVEQDETSSKGRLIVGKAQRRAVRVRLIPLTPALTSMELVVKRNMLASDKATASELLAQTEHALAGRHVGSVSLPHGGEKSSRK